MKLEVYFRAKRRECMRLIGNKQLILYMEISVISVNLTLHQSSHGFATRAHGFPTKTKALAREIPPATQATG